MIIKETTETVNDTEYLDEAATQELINQLKEYAVSELTNNGN